MFISVLRFHRLNWWKIQSLSKASRMVLQNIAGIVTQQAKTVNQREVWLMTCQLQSLNSGKMVYDFFFYTIRKLFEFCAWLPIFSVNDKPEKILKKCSQYCQRLVLFTRKKITAFPCLFLYIFCFLLRIIYWNTKSFLVARGEIYAYFVEKKKQNNSH